MKTKIIFTTMIMAFLFVVYAAEAQDHKRDAKKENKILKQVNAFSGKVGEWINNVNYVYDGFYLQTNTGNLLIRFSTYMGSQLTTALKTGSTISVNGVDNKKNKEIKLISVTTDGITIYDTPPVTIPKVAANEFIKENAKIIEIQKDKKGKLKGFLLDNKSILRMKLNSTDELMKLTVVGANISYTGVKTFLHNGEVASVSYSIIYCKTITINGKQYLAK
ncbi:MAG: hypothetical protein ACOYO1_02655 [Bacteroidales bacterium]